MGIDEHVRTLGSLMIAMGIVAAICSIAGMVILGSPFTMIVNAAQAGTAESMKDPLIQMYLAALILLGILLAAPLVAVGRGIRLYKHWARDAAMVLCALLLAHFPIGSLLALYGFWVVLSPEIEPLFATGNRAGGARR